MSKQPEDRQADKPKNVHRATLDLGNDVFQGILGTVEGVQQSIIDAIVRVNPAALPVSWTSKFVYNRIGDVGWLSYAVAAQLLGLAQALRPGSASDIQDHTRLGIISALNGAFGDHLEARDNDLAIDMSFCVEGHRVAVTPEALQTAVEQPTGDVVILLHGLCLNDTQWRHAGAPDFGDRLQRDLGFTPLRLRYNSGRHISTNGRELADLMQQFVAAYPVPIKRLTLLGHSMGGLVARSACYYANQQKLGWVKQVSEVICLGSPHLGAPLERLGHWFTHSLTRTPFTAPLSSLGKVRSAGIKDLRYCYLRDEDWQDRDIDAREGIKPEPLPLLKHVRYYNVAATLGKSPNDRLDRWFGDLLVPVKSATTPADHHRSRGFSRKGVDGRVFYDMSHFALMHDPDIYSAIYAWLTGKPQRSRRPAFASAKSGRDEKSKIETTK